MFKFRNVVFIAILCTTVGFITGVGVGKLFNLPFISKKGEWAIGIYTGSSPLIFSSPQTVKNPVLTAKDISDIPAAFVADPFMIREGSTWYMFFEVLNKKTNQGDIGLATSDDGMSWTYKKIVLNEEFHLSYPYVFKWNNEFYMVPETYQDNSVRLYRAIDFPEKWSFVTTLLKGIYVDSSIFQHNEKWWILTEPNPLENNMLALYYADKLTGPWIEHPMSPVIKDDPNIARPGGRVIIFDNRIFRYAQDDEPSYGNQVWAFEITKLTTTNYEEKQVDKFPILKADGTGWNGKGMHHIDPHQIGENQWIAAVDGYSEYYSFTP